MARIDIHGFDRRLTRELELLEELDVPQETKELIKEFIDDGLQGWGTTKISKARAAKLLMHLRLITKLLCRNGCSYEYMTEKDLKKLLKDIDNHYYEVKVKKSKDPEKTSWGQSDARTALLKFMKWLRSEKGYPDDYPDKKVAESAKVVMSLNGAKPPELAKLRIMKPEESVKPNDIPEEWVFRSLREASENIRDEAFFTVAEEWGPRIGGIGSLTVGSVKFDDIGAWIYPHDKTHRGEGVRLTWSAGPLRRWMEKHPFRDNLEAPLWVDLNCRQYPKPITYRGFKKIIERAVKRHNKRAEANGGKKIEKNIRTHFFRYFAQIRDEIEGVPRSVQLRQRGWKDGSDQPDRYAMLANVEVDQYYRQKYGKSEEDKGSKAVVCPRCEEVNPPASRHCNKCNLMLDPSERYDTDKSRQALKEVLNMIITGDIDKDRVEKMMDDL
ncbi:MAG: site-specific integrase [Archaeoglobaceae archaeon]